MLPNPVNVAALAENSVSYTPVHPVPVTPPSTLAPLPHPSSKSPASPIKSPLKPLVELKWSPRTDPTPLLGPATLPQLTIDTKKPHASPRTRVIDFASSSSGLPVPSSSLTSLGPPSDTPQKETLLPLAAIVPPEDIDMDDGGEGEDGEGVEEDSLDADEAERENEVEVGGEVGGHGGEEDSGSDDEDEEDEEDEESEGAESEDLEGGSPEPDFISMSGPGGEGSVSLPVGEVAIKVEASESALPSSSGQSVDGAPASAEGTTNVLVPKKKRARRSPSSDEDLPPPPPPMKTIRLERELAPEGQTLEWNILDDAREKGMVSDWGQVEEEKDVAADGATEVDGLIDGPLAGLLGSAGSDEAPEVIAKRLEEKYGDGKSGETKKAKRAKVKRRISDYDLEDTFIDDSELLIDAPTHFGRPKKEGFFVHQGPLELLEESPQKARVKPQVRRARPSAAAAAGPSRPPRKSLAAMTVERMEEIQIKGEGTMTSPIEIDSDLDGRPKAGPSRSPRVERDPMPPAPTEPLRFGTSKATYKNASKDPDASQIPYRPPFTKFPLEVGARLGAIRTASDKHNWDAVRPDGSKEKFPEHIKPLLRSAGVAAMKHDMFGERDEAKDFYTCLPSVLPFNQFTLTKLITKLCHEKYWDWLQECEVNGIAYFGELVERDKESWVSKFEDSHKAWEQDVKDWDEKHPQNTTQGTPVLSSSDPNAIDDPEAPQAADGRPRASPKRFIWNMEMRDVFQQLLDNLQEMVKFAANAQRYQLPNAYVDKEWTEPNMRSRLYKKIVDKFPEGYMTTGAVSREMTKLKKQNQKAQATE